MDIRIPAMGLRMFFSQWSAVADSLNQRKLIGMWIYKIAVVFFTFFEKKLLGWKRNSNFIAQNQAVCHLSGMIFAWFNITKSLLIIKLTDRYETD